MSEMKTVNINGVTYEVHDPDALSGVDTTLSIEGKPADAAAVGAALAGKAPAGYGLGATAKTIAQDLDTVVENGWYCYNKDTCTNTPENVPSMLLVENFYNTNYCKQTVTTLTGTIYIRIRNGGNWYEWGCVNPPMVLGVEYRTTERWNGKVVYTKLVNCGALPAAGAAVHYGIGYDITKILRVNGVPITQGFTVPYISTDAFITVSGTVYDGRAYIVVYVDRGELAEDECIVQAWYIKD